MTYPISKLTTLGLSAIAASAVYVGTSAPAQAGTLTFDYEATIDANVTLTESGAAFLSVFLGELEPVTVEIEEMFAGSFTTLDDPAQYLDGDISVGYDLFADVFDIPESISEVFDIDVFNTFFDLTFLGDGQLTTAAGNLLDFQFNYNRFANTLDFTYDASAGEAALIDDCLTGLCTFSSSFELILSQAVPLFSPPASEAATLSNGLSIPPNAVLFSEGDVFTSVVPQVVETESVPEPSLLIGLLASGGLLVAARRKVVA